MESIPIVFCSTYFLEKLRLTYVIISEFSKEKQEDSLTKMCLPIIYKDTAHIF